MDKHDSRCYKCKNLIYQMLNRIFRKIELKYKVPNIPLSIDAHKSSKHYSALKKIYRGLINYRGQKDFIKARYLQRCDIYIPSEKRIVEIDEVQHYSTARLVSLRKYPEKLKLGYDKTKYKKYCADISSNDPDPVFRDEQRAWYDTLRDFLPYLSNEIKRPTVRIPLGFYAWCKLNTNSKKDIAEFRKLAKL